MKLPRTVGFRSHFWWDVSAFEEQKIVRFSFMISRLYGILLLPCINSLQLKKVILHEIVGVCRRKLLFYYSVYRYKRSHMYTLVYRHIISFKNVFHGWEYFMMEQGKLNWVPAKTINPLISQVYSWFTQILFCRV